MLFRSRDAVNAALRAMSSWRKDIADTSEYNGKRVIEKIAAAAAELGWPEQIVDAARVQMRSIAELQIQTLDHVMDAWEEQLKLPNPTAASPSAMLSQVGPQIGRHLAKRRGFPKGVNEPLAVLDAIRGKMAKILGGHDDFLGRPGKLH